jgi:VWFA-related protein
VVKAWNGVVGLAVMLGVGAFAQTPAAPDANAAPLGSQAPQGYQASTIKVTTRIVVLDVVVTDKQGKLVDQPFTRDDFTVYEDGVAQTIRSFETPVDHAMPAAAAGQAVVNSAADLKKIGDAPVTVLVLDELNSRFEDMSYSRQMMIKYLQEQPKVLKQPTVMMIAENTSFKQVHDYTQDRDALIDVVKKHMPEYPWRMMNGGGKGAGAVERMAQVLAALQQIAQASSGTAGRKNLIWVGNGFPPADLVGLPLEEVAAIEAAIRRCTARMLAARITMYTINPVAGSTVTVEVDDVDDMDQAGMDAGPDPFGQGEASFPAFAAATGGIAFMGRNDLSNVIAEGVAKGEQYYTMSYSPTNKSDDAVKFRSIRVVMKDKTLRATTRDGYFPETAGDLNPVVDKTMAAKQVTANLKLDLSSALTSTMSYNGLAVTAEKAAGGMYTVKVGEQGIGWSEPGAGGEEHEEATVAVAWYDAKGKVLGHVARELMSPRGAAGGGATFQIPVTLTGNPARVRVVVRDAVNGKMGTVDLKGRE